ncbi:thiamine pyrophosphokinase, putative [Metarhizium acridum CQMa 102]|uniref:Thiamine pyrophosphokinase, putative n=1 Tax=Metarhizium acridum (strain CQMa 102) TaxID=655827 RepID=E9EBX0_METAQ|nr:thiamine pyrophosphokinase, putative [Metarhizium acridum CQMa 102]EFY86590.1 thiamine pyrophosphokinase, putative [Metarhizium acridum CQMa 102]
MSTAKFEWHPAKLLEDNAGLQDFALLVLNQPLKNGAILRRLWKNSQVIHDTDQESSDFGKAITWIRKTQPSALDIVALGGIGGRVDQGLSQLHHLYLYQTDPAYANGRIYLLSGSSLTFLLKSGTHMIHVKEDGEDEVFGKHVGIIPLQEPSRITTKGLEWDVTDWESKIGGKLSTSNHVLPHTKCVEVHTTKDVLFTVALRPVEGEEEA